MYNNEPLERCCGCDSYVKKERDGASNSHVRIELACSQVQAPMTDISQFVLCKLMSKYFGWALEGKTSASRVCSSERPSSFTRQPEKINVCRLTKLQ